MSKSYIWYKRKYLQSTNPQHHELIYNLLSWIHNFPLTNTYKDRIYTLVYSNNRRDIISIPNWNISQSKIYTHHTDQSFYFRTRLWYINIFTNRGIIRSHLRFIVFIERNITHLQNLFKMRNHFKGIRKMKFIGFINFSIDCNYQNLIIQLFW